MVRLAYCKIAISLIRSHFFGEVELAVTHTENVAFVLVSKLENVLQILFWWGD